MQPLKFKSLRFGLFTAFLLGSCAVGTSFADQVVKTYPPGDGKELMEKTDTNGFAGGAIIRDKECAKKSAKDSALKQGEPSPVYEKCVKDKLERAKKTGDH
jgi:hypothetical protein